MGNIANDADEEAGTYPLPSIEYLNFNESLIEGVHNDLPNPYYKHQSYIANERSDYAHPTENIIRSIIREYGPFSELTEEKLGKLIKKDVDSMDVDGVNENGSGNDVVSSELLATSSSAGMEKEVEFYAARDEILKCVREALGSSTLTLDFVSLLLSSVRPAAGSSSMSPHLKENIKIGSLSCDRIVPNVPDPDEERRQHNIESMTFGRGLKLQSLQKSASLVKDSVQQLKKNLDDENTYWNEVLDVLEENELITTVSAPLTVPGSSGGFSKQGSSVRQRRVLSVKYGYGDSGSDYFDNGIAILQKGEGGHIVFEKLNKNEREKTWGGPKIVSVKIFKKPTYANESPQLIGQSDSYGMLKQEIVHEDESFVLKVKNSRFFIFENELFWHLMKEAAGLITVQVSVVDSCIKVDLVDCYLQLEALDIESEEAKIPTPQLPANNRADQIIKFFRILLCANNYKNIQKLRIPPVALSKDATAQKNKHGVLIRPVIMYTKHNHMIDQFKEMLRSLLLELGTDDAKAKEIIESDLIVKKYVNDPNLLQQFQLLKRCYNNDPFLRVYSKMAPSSLLILKNGNLKVWIELNSSYTTLHISMNVKVTKIDSGEILLESTFNSKEDVEQCLSWILKQHK